MEVLGRLKNLRIFRPLLRAHYRRRFANNRNEQLFHGVYRSMSEAARSAPRTRPLGYDHPDAAAMYRNMIDQVTIADYPILYWMQHLAGEVQSVFDYGGHVGIKYYAYSRFLAFPASLVWTVCDVPHVARAGADLAGERAAAKLRFVSEFERVEGQDLLLCSGSLQYIDESLATLLSRVPRRPRHVLVNLTPFTQGSTFFTLNGIGTAFCPYKVQDLAGFISEMDGLGYAVVHRWTIPGKRIDIPLFPERSRTEYLGMRLEAKPR